MTRLRSVIHDAAVVATGREGSGGGLEAADARLDLAGADGVAGGDGGEVGLATAGGAALGAGGAETSSGSSWALIASLSRTSASARIWETRDSETPSCSAISAIGRSARKYSWTTTRSRSGSSATASTM